MLERKRFRGIIFTLCIVFIFSSYTNASSYDKNFLKDLSIDNTNIENLSILKNYIINTFDFDNLRADIPGSGLVSLPCPHDMILDIQIKRSQF